MITNRFAVDSPFAAMATGDPYRSIDVGTAGAKPGAVAITVLPAHVGNNKGRLAALSREFARLRTLHHPHIARLFDLARDGERYYVTGEQLDGESLRDVLDHLAPEHLEPAEADDIVRAVGSALLYAHERGVTHGNVRAENVIVTMDRKFVLTHFLARRVAKVNPRAATPAHDVRGLAKLAAELYTGSSSGDAPRHGRVPGVRLRAIRAVLHTDSSRRTGSIATFLASAGLPMESELYEPPELAEEREPRGPRDLRDLREPRKSREPVELRAHLRRAAEAPRRAWPFWQVVLPVAAVIGIGGLLASASGSDWRASVVEIKALGLEALRSVSALRAPVRQNEAALGAIPGEPLAEATSTQTEPVAAVAAPADSSVSAPAPPDAAGAGEPSAPATEPIAPSIAPSRNDNLRETRPAAASAAPPSLAVATAAVAAREDHSVVSIEVVRSGDTSRATSVTWWTTPGTAREYDDYVGFGRQTTVVPAGATRVQLLVPIVNDGLREPDETFTLRLARTRDGEAFTAARVTLHDDD